MARWIPDPAQPIGHKEQIGRRIFPKQALKAASSQPASAALFTVSDFEESRGACDVSVDRLGQTGIDKRVCTLLAPMAQAAAAARQNVSFHGWAVALAEDISRPRKGQAIPVVSSPTPEMPPLPANPYHAHIDGTGWNHYVLAVYLHSIFVKRNQLQTWPVSASTINSFPENRGWLQSLGSLISKFWKTKSK
jgi:hypothetical protein